MSITSASLSTFLIAKFFLLFCNRLICFQFFFCIFHIAHLCMEFPLLLINIISIVLSIIDKCIMFPYIPHIYIPNNFMKIWNIEWDFFRSIWQEKSRRKCGTVYNTKWSYSISAIFPMAYTAPHHTPCMLYCTNLYIWNSSWKKSYYGNRTLLYRFLLRGKLCPSK